MKNYLVISPNGYGNVGDDICAWGGKIAIEEVDNESSVVISQPPMKKSLVDWADVVVLSGGGVIYDRAKDNVENYLQYIDYAVSRNKKAIVLGVGVQGIVTDWGAKRYRDTLSKCEFVSVRTEGDKKLLDNIGFNNAVSTFDVAFHAPNGLNKIDIPLVKRAKNYFFKNNIDSSATNIGMSIIDLKKLKKDSYGGSFKHFDEQVKNFLSRKSDSVHVHLLQHAKEDGPYLRYLAATYKNTSFVPYREISDFPNLYSLYKKMDLVIGMRLHCIALGIMTKKPTIAVGSSAAKQKRLAKYHLPTIDSQFLDFENVEKIKSFFIDITDPDSINNYSTLTENEYEFIDNNLKSDLDHIQATIN